MKPFKLNVLLHACLPVAAPALAVPYAGFGPVGHSQHKNDGSLETRAGTQYPLSQAKPGCDPIIFSAIILMVAATTLNSPSWFMFCLKRYKQGGHRPPIAAGGIDRT